MKSKRQFILDTLSPYKRDPSTCGYEDGNCCYLTKDGKTCAVGKHLIKGNHTNSRVNVAGLFRRCNPNDILTQEAKKQNLSVSEWAKIQKYHDAIALKSNVSVINIFLSKIETTTGLKFPELKF